MLLLIGTHRHQIRLIQQNICRHQYRIGKESGCDIVSMLLGLLLKLSHTAQFTELRIAAQDPAQLCMLRHMALNKHNVLLRIQTTGNILCQLMDTALTQICRILTNSNGVHIHNAVNALIFILQCYPVLNSTHIGTQSQITTGLNTAEYSLFLLVFHGRHLFIFILPK